MTTPTPPSTLPPPRGTDVPIAVHGFVTDPKLVGYQVLTNYESTYWAPLVGIEAWRLFEVLRSFCHQDHNSCYPSINLLLAILGIKDRSVLIGRTKPKVVNGKEYSYRGLIQMLQTHNLVIAEAEGEGPTVRYTFHVNMTPGLLTDDQLAQLPEILQKKHAELLERCAEEQRKLEAKKLPPKLQTDASKDTPKKLEDQGIGNSNTPLGISNTPLGNSKTNNNQLTIPIKQSPPRGAKINNNTGGASTAVVVALIQLGLAAATAQRLAQHYSQARIEEKIAFIGFLQEDQPEKVKNPRGWLRRAIEEDYGPPDGYLSAEERDRRRREAERQDVQETALVEARQVALTAAAAEQAARVQRRRDEYGATAADIEFWAEAREAIRDTTTPHVYELVADTELLQLSEDTLRIGVRSEAEERQLTHPGSMKAIERTLSRLAGRPLALQVEVLT